MWGWCCSALVRISTSVDPRRAMIAICMVRVFVVLPKKVLAMVTRTRRMMSRMSLRRTRRQLLRNAVVAISTGLL